MPIRISLRDGSGRGGRRAPRATRVVDSLAAVAEFAGVTVPSVAAWFGRGAPVTEDGRYDLWEIARWHADAHAGRSRGGGDVAADGERAGELDHDDDGDDVGDDSPDATDDLATLPDARRSDWSIRRVRAAALTAELKLKEATGAVVPRADHDRAIFKVVDTFVSALESMPPRVVPLLLATRGYTEVEGILREHIRSMRIQLVALLSEGGNVAGA